MVLARQQTLVGRLQTANLYDERGSGGREKGSFIHGAYATLQDLTGFTLIEGMRALYPV